MMERDQMVFPSVPGLEVGVSFGTPSNILDTAVNVRDTASVAERKKTPNYQDLTVNYLFHPVAFDMFMSMLAARLTGVSGGAREDAWLSQCHSHAIARGNAASVMTCYNRFR